MIYSKTCEYAIRALKYLASKNNRALTSVAEMNKHTGVPSAYLAKVFQCLAREGIVRSKSGPQGGYSLAAHPAQLTVFRVMSAVDDMAVSPLSNCVMGQAECNDRNPCSLHPIWAKAKEEMNRVLKKQTLTDLLECKKGSYAGKKPRAVLSVRMHKIFGHGAAKGGKA